MKAVAKLVQLWLVTLRPLLHGGRLCPILYIIWFIDSLLATKLQEIDISYGCLILVSPYVNVVENVVTLRLLLHGGRFCPILYSIHWFPDRIKRSAPPRSAIFGIYVDGCMLDSGFSTWKGFARFSSPAAFPQFYATWVCLLCHVPLHGCYMLCKLVWDSSAQVVRANGIHPTPALWKIHIPSQWNMNRSPLISTKLQMSLTGRPPDGCRAKAGSGASRCKPPARRVTPGCKWNMAPADSLGDTNGDGKGRLTGRAILRHPDVCTLLAAAGDLGSLLPPGGVRPGKSLL